MSQKSSQEKKKSKDFLMFGGAICFILGVLLFLTLGNFYAGIGLVIIGSILASAGLWMNVIAQNKNRKF